MREMEICKWPHLAVVSVAGEFICHEIEQDISPPAGDPKLNSWKLNGAFLLACHFHSHENKNGLGLGSCAEFFLRSYLPSQLPFICAATTPFSL